MPRPGRLRRKVFVNRAMPPLASARFLERRPRFNARAWLLTDRSEAMLGDYRLEERFAAKKLRRENPVERRPNRPRTARVLRFTRTVANPTRSEWLET
jgi:hypothetical protein